MSLASSGHPSPSHITLKLFCTLNSHLPLLNLSNLTMGMLVLWAAVLNVLLYVFFCFFYNMTFVVNLGVGVFTSASDVS